MDILVIDDEIFICQLLDEFLSNLGYDVAIAACGDEALAMLSKQRFDVVLMDIRMPGMSGPELLDKIKAIDSSAFVIVVSAFGDGVTVNEMLQKGADDFLVKPFGLDHLEEVLSARNKLLCENDQ